MSRFKTSRAVVMVGWMVFLPSFSPLPCYSFNGSLADLHANGREYQNWLEERYDRWEDRLDSLPASEKILLENTLKQLRSSIQSVAVDRAGYSETSEQLFQRLNRQYKVARHAMRTRTVLAE